ncbi:hypothetical protein [Bacillus cereus]|uniref:hypothetical protein n=1 Tax=Bacillus cereus TaxID=1396 RepID=UPI003980077E
MYEAREKALMDEAAKFAHARNQGREEEEMQLIRGMHKNDVSVEDIARLTGLTESEIQQS